MNAHVGILFRDRLSEGRRQLGRVRLTHRHRAQPHLGVGASRCPACRHSEALTPSSSVQNLLGRLDQVGRVAAIAIDQYGVQAAGYGAIVVGGRIVAETGRARD